MSTSSSSTPGSPATARPCTRAGCPARDGSSWSRRSRSAAARSPCITGARADGPAVPPFLRAHHGVNCVYVLFSDRRKRTYVGVTGDPRGRLDFHNQGLVTSTRYGRPWRILVEIWFDTETAALDFERYLKSGSGKAFMYRHFLTDS